MRVIISRSHIQAAIEGLKRLQAGRLPAVVRIEATGRRCCFSMQGASEQASYEVAPASVREGGCVFVELGSLIQFGKTKGDDEVRIESSEGQVTFVSNDSTREAITGVCLDASTKDKRIVATDGRRASAFAYDLPTGGQAIVPSRKFLQWSKLDEPLAIGVGNSMFRLDSGPWTYCVRLVNGTYPNWRQVVPDVKGAVTIALTDGQVSTLKELLPSLPVPNPGDQAVLLCRWGGQVAVCSQNGVDGNWQVVPVGEPDGGGDCEVLLDRRFALEALNAGFSEFKIGGHDVPIVSRTAQGDCHVLMPMQMDENSLKSIVQGIGAREPQKQKEKASKEREPVTVEADETSKEENMNETDQTSALDRLQELYRQAREKVREANSVLTDIASCIRDAAREEKQYKAEVAAVRAGLNKLKAIKV